MKKRLLLLVSLLSGTVFSQAVSDSITLGASYSDQVFYQLSSGNKTASDNQEWDLQFFSSLFSASIRINGGVGVELYEPSNSDTANFTSTTIDTVGATILRNGNDFWENDAFTSTATGHPDYGWGTYVGVGLLKGKKVYIIKLTSGTWKKIWVKEVNPSGPIYFTIADLDGSNSVDRTVNRTSYNTKYHFYYDVDNDSVYDVEPLKDDWELVFRKYTDDLGGGSYYNVTGGLSNYNVGIAEVRNVEVGTAMANWNTYPLDSAINVVGHDWKEFNMSTFMWDIEDSLSYFVQTIAGDVYQIIFTKWNGSSDGKFYFTKELVSAASIDENNGFKSFGVYPNPVQNQLNLNYELTQHEVINFEILNLNGQVVKTFNNSGASEGFNQGSISVEELTKGTYLLVARTSKGVHTERFIKL